jgi:hypothetical protein
MALTEADRESVRQRAAEALVAAWPEGQITIGDVLTSLSLDEGEDADGPYVQLRLWGRKTTVWGLTTADDLNAMVADWVEGQADDLEHDRWLMGAWREWGEGRDT